MPTRRSAAVATPPPTTEAWALLADPPGARDLAQPRYWDVSLERSRRRRAASSQPRLQAPALRQVSIVLATAALGGPTVVGADAHQTGATASGQTLDIGRGATGPQVRAVQRALGIAADGIFGSRTEHAVRSFQRAHRLPVTGVVGPLTRRALQLGDHPPGGQAPQRRPAADGAPITLAGGDVRALQRALGVTPDGQLGPLTRSALRRFEAAHGLPADGRPDTAVLKALGITPGGGEPDTSDPAGGGPPPATQGPGATAVNAALSKVGASYRYGSAGPSAFDCSGLVMWALGQAGVTAPHSSYAQYSLGRSVAGDAIQAGDLVFFNTAGPGASDVGIAVAPNRAVSATTHGVRTHSIKSGYWGSHFVGARRIV